MANNHSVCRLCLNEIEEQNISLFSDYQNIEYYYIIATALANITITKDDKLPDKICNECASKLVLFFKFKQKCESTERTLRRLILKEKVPVPVTSSVSNKITMENLLKKYTKVENCADEKVEIKKHFVKEKVSFPVLDEKTTEPEEQEENYVEYKVTVKSFDNEEPEMEAEYLLEEFQGSHQIETTSVKEETVSDDYEDMEINETDDEELLVSPILQRTTQQNSELQKMTQIKTKLKPLSKSCICELCGKGYAHPSSLQQHYQSHTGIKNFSCDLCDTKFTRKSHLGVHMRIHNNEKPYICEICSMTFRKSGNLNRHMVVHSDKREFACTLCDKAFKRSSGLHIHLRSHTGDRPYQCKWCSKTYSCYSGFRKHKIKHENSFKNAQGNQIEVQILSKSDEIDSDQEPYLSRELNEIVTNEDDDALKSEN